MAVLNQENTTGSGRAEAEKPSHYVNIQLVRADGSTLRLGSFPIFPSKADKVQRTLLAEHAKGTDCSKFAIKMEVNSAEKSTDLADSSEWAIMNIVDTPAE